MSEYERLCWLRIGCHAMQWPRHARVELGEWLVERGRRDGDDFFVGAGQAIRDYETPPVIAALRARA